MKLLSSVQPNICHLYVGLLYKNKNRIFSKGNQVDVFLLFQACLLVLDYYVLPEFCELANECKETYVEGHAGQKDNVRER